jgi:uncharacterized protein
MKEYFQSFTSNMPWLQSRTIFLTKHGSHAYGTNLPTSDLDLKGVGIPPREYFMGFSKVFEQAQTNTPNDFVVYDLRKFMNLAADCNPSIIEVLWTDREDWVIVTDAGEELIENREVFISKKARWTFSGYAMSQLKRINLHYKWLKDPPAAPPQRGDYGLPERTVIPKDQLAAADAAIQKKIDSWSPDLTGVDDATRTRLMTWFYDALLEITTNKTDTVADVQWAAAANTLGYDTNFIELLDRERKYRTKHKEWDSYQTWKESRNVARAELEAKYSYDTKHAMHLVRLMRMCTEILKTGKVLVKRPDKDELLAIRHGAWSYEQLVEWAAKQDKEMDALYKTSPIRREPDRKSLDNLCISLVERSLTS